MNISSLHQTKSLKKFGEVNPKVTQVLSQPISQPNRQSAVNLSKLGAYKGKFSLTSKYSSLSSHNNHELNHHSHQNNNYRGQYMSESNKQNIASRANINIENGRHKKEHTMNETDKVSIVNNFHNHEKREKSYLQAQFKERPLSTGFKLKVIKTDPIHEGDEEQTENMRKILMAASQFNLKNPQPNKSLPHCKESAKNDNFIPTKKHSNSQKQKGNQKNTKDKNSQYQKSLGAQRRSKFHKYDNSTDENEFLVIDQQASTAKEKKFGAQKKTPHVQAFQKKELLPPPAQRVHTSTMRLSEFQIAKQIEQEKQIQGYMQSIKHITYSMIKMISLIGRIETGVGANDDNLRIISQIRNQIFAIYTKELATYVDRFNIKAELIGMARQEEEFINQSQSKLPSDKSLVTAKNHKNKQQIAIQSPQSSNDDHLLHENSSVQGSPDSLLHQYQIRESWSGKNSLKSDSLNQQEENSSSSNFFDFDSIKQLEIMPSGRNLLETFNNQHLCCELQVIGKELINQSKHSGDSDQSQEDSGQIVESNKNKFAKEDTRQKISEIDPHTYQTYEENLIYGLRQINIEEAEPPETEQNPSQVCRKLFNQQQSSFKSTQNLSPINHLHSTTSLKSAHSNNLQPCLQILEPEHYYEVVACFESVDQNLSNYLRVRKGDKIKLLRKVDGGRWIAELQDRIGFVDERVVRGVKLIGATGRKNEEEIR